MSYPHSHRHGFSLLELSLVLAILGLLVGGVMVGKSLVRASELRAISNEYTRYLTAEKTFEDVYQAVPGDMRNATSYWGKDNTLCSGHTGTASATGTCNGNGNGILNEASGSSSPGEQYVFWVHLARAGLIQGNYTGIPDGGGRYDVKFGTNSPASQYEHAGWVVFNFYDYGGSSSFVGNVHFFAYAYGNMFLFMNEQSSPTTWTPSPVLAPTDAWYIDKKLDDGLPGRGRVVTFWQNCTTATNKIDYDAVYDQSNEAVECVLIFTGQFGSSV